MDMRKELHIVVSLALLACLLPPILTGCGKDSLAVDGKLSIPVFLSVGDLPTGVETKMTDQIVQNDDPQTFRGIHNFHVIPFNISHEFVEGQDQCFEENIQMADKLNTYSLTGSDASWGYYSGGSYVKNLTNSVLMYGEAAALSSETIQLGTVAYKQRYGVIVPNEAVTNRTNGIKKAEVLAFDLEPILSDQDKFSTWRSNHLAMLNAIANATSGTGTFKDPATYGDDATLSAAFRTFSGEGQVFSSANLPVLLTNLYRLCFSMPSTAKTAAVDVANKIRTVIESYATATSPLLSISGSGQDASVSLVQPVNAVFGLPEGTVAFQWGKLLVGTSGSGFGSPDKSEGVNIVPDKYCFPPALWYYVNSPLLGSSTSGTEDRFRTNPTWADIVNAKDKIEGTPIYTRGVVLDTKAALVRDPLQYAVGMLSLKLNGPSPSTATELADNKGKKISIEDTNFPLTGIIIGGQRTQNFDFTASNGDIRFIYDADVNDSFGTAKSWLSFNETCKPVYTLTFPTRKEEDVYFALEFCNESGESFTGARNCTILPGSKFYLIGKMEYSKGTTSNGASAPDAVFVKDHITTLTVSFEALAGAYSVLPELATRDLQIGVKAKLDWDVVTPYSHVLQ